MKITVTGSLGNIGKPLTSLLIAAGQQVTVISSQEKNSAAIQTLGAAAAIGSIEDRAFLERTFKGADLVFTLVPPNFAASDLRKHIAGVVKNYAEAIQKVRVPRVVNLSSIGAHLTGGTGPIAGLHDGEASLDKLEGVAIKHLRPAFFYTNFLHNISMIRNSGIQGSNYPASTPMVLVHPTDIAQAAFEEIQQSFSGQSIRYVASDEHTIAEVTAALGSAIGQPDLRWIAFTDEEALQGMIQGGMPAEIARNYVEMGTAVRTGKIWEDYQLHKPAALGKTKLESFADEFAAIYRQSVAVA